jgi:HEPN domain-containing protein
MSRNTDLARDYIRRSEARLGTLPVLMKAKSWADVVRESQEIVELALKGLLRASGVVPPRVHDVSDVLLAERQRLPPGVVAKLASLVEISRHLRRDRELAFYGAEDLTPSDFYSRADAEQARKGAQTVVSIVRDNTSIETTP